MTGKRFTYEYDKHNGILFDNGMNTFYPIEDSDENIKLLCDRLNLLVEENEQLKVRFKEERETAMRLSRECDTLTIKKQELELEIIRLETIIKTGDNNGCDRTS